VAVVTGAASGLGRALAGELVSRQCHLALLDVDVSSLQTATQELGGAGIKLTQHCVDVACEEAMKDAAADISRAHGAVHLLINNAAVSASAAFDATTSEAFERILRVNFFGVVHGCRAFLPLLQKHGEGQILNVSSCFAWLGYPRKTAYATSKAAIRGFSESLRLELADREVGVTLLYPGPLSTSLVRSGIAESEEGRAREEDFLRRRGARVDRVARCCLDRLLDNPARIVMSLDYRMMDAMARLSPGLANRVMGWGARRARF
jgi:NAD(P)-dependent dehydrogenase (short-subunit alcohol dehydrogenase family)